MARLNIKDLLLAPKLTPRQVATLLSPYGFKEIGKADANLQEMADDPQTRRILTEILEELLSCLSRSADPDRAINYLERFAKAAINKASLFSYLKGSPRTLEILAKTFGASPFMAEILIRDPEYLYWLSDPQVLDRERKRKEIEKDLSEALKNIRSHEKKLDILRIVKRREILRIGVRDLLRLSLIQETVASLSVLAEVLIQKAYEICEGSLLKNGKKGRTGFTVLGMGKLGGGELNFSSDVDLIYLYGTEKLAADYFKPLAQKITAALSEVANEGYVYRVDLLLRPEGKQGGIASSLKAFKQYYASRGTTWERMALIKAWPVAGDQALGKKFLSMVRPFIYEKLLDSEAVGEIKKIKERIDRKVLSRDQTHRNVKLGFGGIREIEFIVQALQIFSGGPSSDLRERNTINALRSLKKHRHLSEEDHRALSEAYLFLRDVENKLQMVYDFQTHALPEDEKELRDCALRLGYRDENRETAAGKFLNDYRCHTAGVNRIFQSVFNSSRLIR
jgi:glutamate-ammonia-ligase adenylyltransferase